MYTEEAFSQSHNAYTVFINSVKGLYEALVNKLLINDLFQLLNLLEMVHYLEGFCVMDGSNI